MDKFLYHVWEIGRFRDTYYVLRSILFCTSAITVCFSNGCSWAEACSSCVEAHHLFDHGIFCNPGRIGIFIAAWNCRLDFPSNVDRCSQDQCQQKTLLAVWHPNHVYYVVVILDLQNQTDSIVGIFDTYLGTLSFFGLITKIINYINCTFGI